VARQLEAGELAFAVIDKLLLASACPGAQFDEGSRHLNIARIGQADDLRELHGGMAMQHRFDFRGRDISPPTFSMSLVRPWNMICPSASNEPISPVWNQPSASITSAVFSGALSVTASMFGPRATISPCTPNGHSTPVSTSTIRTSQSSSGTPSRQPRASQLSVGRLVQIVPEPSVRPYVPTMIVCGRSEEQEWILGRLQALANQHIKPTPPLGTELCLSVCID